MTGHADRAHGVTWLVRVAKKNKTSQLQQSVEHAIRKYLEDLDGEMPCDLFETVISEIEQPMLKTVLRHCDNNQSKTASCLGINRGTLRKKLKQYHIEH
jgi:Fis family transcriptional regulator, factor for inversion stimulation protein